MAQANRPETVRISVDPDLRDFIPGFLHNRRRDIQTLLDAIAVGDFETIGTLGHRMRGDAGDVCPREEDTGHYGVCTGINYVS